MRRLGACGIGHVLGSCIVPAYASDNTGPEFIVSVAAFIVSVASAAFSYKQVEEAKRSADEAKRSADQEFKASEEGKIQAAVAKVMKPFEPSKTEKEVIKRPMMGTISERIKSWDEHATIIGPIRKASGSRRSLARSARRISIHHRKSRLEGSNVQGTASG